MEERWSRYVNFLTNQQLKEAYSYERALIKKRAEPDIIWMIKRELYYPDDELIGQEFSEK